jgi:hypothetical protein
MITIFICVVVQHTLDKLGGTFLTSFPFWIIYMSLPLNVVIRLSRNLVCVKVGIDRVPIS